MAIQASSDPTEIRVRVQERTSGVFWRADTRLCDAPTSQKTPASSSRAVNQVLS
jgi:hypothetical protein